VTVTLSNGTTTTLTPFGSGWAGGVSVATGDVNGDGVRDVVAGAAAGGGPRVVVLSGIDGTELISFFAFHPTFTGGVNVASADLNGDGVADIIVAAGPGGGPHVKVFDGSTGAEIASFYAYAPAFGGGVNVAAGDVTGDGVADIVTGAGSGGSPHVKVFDGAIRQEVRSFFAYGLGFGGGVDVAVTTDARIVTAAGPGGGPHVKVFDSAVTELTSFFAYDPAFVGGATVGGGVNGQFRVGSGPGIAPRVKTYGPAFDLLSDEPVFATDFLGGVMVG
jgi:hypothetical protein